MTAVDTRRTVADQAFVELRARIMSGELAPGTLLHLERLARDLEMSPMPVREAIRRLSALGLVHQAPHRSAYVSHVSREDLRDVFQMRLALEGVAIRLAVEKWDEAAAERAGVGLSRTAQAERSGDFNAIWAADQEFHLALYGAAGSQWLIRLISPLWETSERYHRLAGLPMRDFGKRHSDHLAILDACILDNGWLAASRLCDHLVRAANLLSNAMDGGSLFSSTEIHSLNLPLPLA